MWPFRKNKAEKVGKLTEDLIQWYGGDDKSWADVTRDLESGELEVLQRTVDERLGRKEDKVDKFLREYIKGGE